MFLLTVVTLGIYRLYWFAKTRAEMMNLNKDIKIPHIIWLVAPVLIVVAAVAMFISSGAATASEKVGGDAMTGLQIGSIIAFYVSILAVPVLMAIWLWKYSKGVEVVTGEKMSFSLAALSNSLSLDSRQEEKPSCKIPGTGFSRLQKLWKTYTDFPSAPVFFERNTSSAVGILSSPS